MSTAASDDHAVVLEHFTDPVLFAHEILGCQLWQGEEDLLRSVATEPRTAVKACHASGKTFTAAIAVLWWLARYRDGIVLTTSPTLRQVETQIWEEIPKLAAKSRFPFPPCNKSELRLAEGNYAIGLSTDRVTNLQGYHGRILIVVDEAPGINAEIWQAIEGIMAGGQVHVLMLGNPTVPSGPFYNAFTTQRSLWNCLTIDAFDTPNLAGVSLEALLAMSGDELDTNAVRYLVDRRWVREHYTMWWQDSTRTSPEWQARVRGEFPEQSETALIPLQWLEAAAVPAVDDGGRLVVGIDVGAGGRAETAVQVCQVRGDAAVVLASGGWRGEDCLPQVLHFLMPYKGRVQVIRVDKVGVGHNFVPRLRAEGFSVEGVGAGEKASDVRDPDGVRASERYMHLKDERYFRLQRLFLDQRITGLTDAITMEQLTGLQYEIVGSGKLRIEPKEKAAARSLASPDRAEALMLALGAPVVNYGDGYRAGTDPPRSSPLGGEPYYDDDLPAGPHSGRKGVFGRGGW